MLSTVSKPKALIDDYLEPYTMAYMKLKNCEYTSTKNAEEINGFLYWLNKNNNYDWMPSAILFMTLYPDDSDYFLWFVRKLERIASYLQVTAQDVNHRMARYKFVLAEMKERPDSSIDNPLKNIELTEWEKEQLGIRLMMIILSCFREVRYPRMLQMASCRVIRISETL